MCLALDLPAVSSAGALAGKLLEKLHTQDVILRVERLHRLDEGLTGFTDRVWRPLFATLERQSSHRFVLIGSYEGGDVTERSPESVSRPTEDEEGAFVADAALPVALPVQSKISAVQLESWLRPWVPDQAAATRVAEVLMAESGGEPPVLFQKLLLDDSTWS
jgi:hypothetical protein